MIYLLYRLFSRRRDRVPTDRVTEGRILSKAVNVIRRPPPLGGINDTGLPAPTLQVMVRPHQAHGESHLHFAETELSITEENICRNLPLPQKQPQPTTKLPPRWQTAASLRPGVWLTHAVADGDEDAKAIADAYRFRFPVTRLAPTEYRETVDRGLTGVPDVFSTDVSLKPDAFQCGLVADDKNAKPTTTSDKTFSLGRKESNICDGVSTRFSEGDKDLHSVAVAWHADPSEDRFQALQRAVLRFSNLLASSSETLRAATLEEDAASDFLIYLLEENSKGRTPLSSWDGQRNIKTWLRKVWSGFVSVRYYKGKQRRPGLNWKSVNEIGTVSRPEDAEDTEERPFRESWDDSREDHALAKEWEAHRRRKEVFNNLSSSEKALAVLRTQVTTKKEMATILDICQPTLRKQLRALDVKLETAVRA